MKQIKILAALFIALVAMSSCSKDDDSSAEDKPLAEQLVGEWIMEQEVDGLEANEDSDIEIPTDADMFTIIFHFNADGTGWKECVIMKEGKCIFDVISRYGDGEFTYTLDKEGKVIVDYPEDEIGDELTFDGKSLTTLIDGLHFNFVRATEDQMEKYKEEADAIHGGSAEEDTTDTPISDQEAEEPSRAKKRP